MPEKLQKTTGPIPVFLFYLLLFSLFLVPPIPLKEGWPKVQVAELLLPLLALFIVLHQNFLLGVRLMKTILTILGIYCAVILLSIIVNSRTGMVRDYFEILKLIKFCIIMVFVFLFAEKINWMKTMRWIFSFMLLFNILHYINFMDFNKHIQVFYGNILHINTFGLNSIGEPATKRILGTAGNPNNNAILFLFFSIFFLPQNKSTITEKIFFYLAVLGVLACQSRTGFIAFCAVYLCAAVLLKYTVKKTIIDILIFSGLYLFLYVLGNVYLSALSGNIFMISSLRGRYETWLILLEMIKQKPFIGWSPYKEFISENIYPEGEYIFVAWKYGVIGLLVHLAWMSYASILAWRERVNRQAINLFLFTIVLFVVSITNMPLYIQSTLLLFAILLGLFFNSKVNYSKR